MKRELKEKGQMFGWLWFTLLYSAYLHRWMVSPGKGYRVTVADLIQPASLPPRALILSVSNGERKVAKPSRVHVYEWLS